MTKPRILGFEGSFLYPQGNGKPLMSIRHIRLEIRNSNNNKTKAPCTERNGLKGSKRELVRDQERGNSISTWKTLEPGIKENGQMVRVRERRVAHLKNWVKGHLGQESREQWKETLWAGKEQKFTLEHAEFQDKVV